MAAPTTSACVKKTLANPEPSTHGPLPTSACILACLQLAKADLRALSKGSVFAQVFGRRHPRCQPRAPAAGVRKAPRHEIAVGERRRVPQLWGFRRGR